MAPPFIEQRLYPLQSNPHCRFHWGFYTGTGSCGRQVFVARTNNEKVAVLFIDGNGSFLELGRESLPEFPSQPENIYWDVNEADFHRYLSDKFEFVPATIRVERFDILEEQIRIVDMPHLYRLILEKPEIFDWDDSTLKRYLAEIDEWVAAKSFVLECRNEVSHHLIDSQGCLITLEGKY